MARTSRATLQGADELQEALAKMLGETEDLTEAWTDIYHPAVLDAEKDFFATEGDGKWKPLTPRYELYKATHGGGTRLLVGTPRRKKYPRPGGELMRSLTQDGADHIFTPSKRWVRIGSSDKLANIFFTAKGKRKRRPMDAKSLSMQMALQKAVREHLDRYAEMWGGSP